MKHLLLGLSLTISCVRAMHLPINFEERDYLSGDLLSTNAKDYCFIAMLATDRSPGSFTTYRAETVVGWLDAQQGTVWVDPKTDRPLLEIALFFATLKANKHTRVKTITYDHVGRRPEELQKRPAILAASPLLSFATGGSGWDEELYNKIFQKYADRYRKNS